MQRLLLLALAVCAVSCTAPDRTRDTLQKAGYTNIQTGGYSLMACGEGDNYATEFTATNPQGRRVQGTVCCGTLKSCTVRF